MFQKQFRMPLCTKQKYLMMNGRRESQAIEELSQIKLQASRSDSRKEVSTSPESPSRRQEFKEQLKSQDRVSTLLAVQQKRAPLEVSLVSDRVGGEKLRKGVEKIKQQMTQRQEELKILIQGKKKGQQIIKKKRVQKNRLIKRFQLKIQEFKEKLALTEKDLKDIDVQQINLQQTIAMKQIQIFQLKKELRIAQWDEDKLQKNNYDCKQEVSRQAFRILQENLKKMKSQLKKKVEEFNSIDYQYQMLHDKHYHTQIQYQVLCEKNSKEKEELPRNSSQKQEKRTTFGKRKESQQLEDVNIPYRQSHDVSMSVSMAEQLNPLLLDPSLTSYLLTE